MLSAILDNLFTKGSPFDKVWTDNFGAIMVGLS